MNKIDPFDIRTYPNFKFLRESFLKNLPENFDLTNKEDCFIWQGTQRRNGYGKITWGGKHYVPHKISYLIFNGLIKPNQVVRHTCDNKFCINPNHLIIGTQSDNIIDCVKRNRHHNQKLTKEEVIEIKKELKNPYKGINKELALKYNVTHNAISQIRTGRNWYWV